MLIQAAMVSFGGCKQDSCRSSAQQGLSILLRPYLKALLNNCSTTAHIHERVIACAVSSPPARFVYSPNVAKWLYRTPLRPSVGTLHNELLALHSCWFSRTYPRAQHTGRIAAQAHLQAHPAIRIDPVVPSVIRYPYKYEGTEYSYRQSRPGFFSSASASKSMSPRTCVPRLRVGFSIAFQRGELGLAPSIKVHIQQR